MKNFLLSYLYQIKNLLEFEELCEIRTTWEWDVCREWLAEPTIVAEDRNPLDLCNILHCQVEDIMEYIPSDQDQRL